MNTLAQLPRDKLKYKFNEHWIDEEITLHVPNQFATITDALTWLDDKKWPDSVTVTISVGAGVHTYTSTINVEHSGKIKIIGADPVTTTISSLGTVTGSAGNWAMQINVADSTGIEVGDFCIVRNTTGTGNHQNNQGFWEVTVKSSNLLTFKNTNQNSTYPTTTLTGGNVVKMPTVLKFTADVDGIYCNSGNIDKCALVNLAVTATVSSTQKGVSGIFKTENVGVINFSHGFSCSGNQKAHLTSSAVSGTLSRAVYSRSSSNITAAECVVSGNVGNGLLLTEAAVIYTNNTVICGNGGKGIYNDLHSICVPYTNTWIDDNVGTDIYSRYNSVCSANAVTGSPALSPAANVEGNYGAWNRV